jgi:hypothetical protein
VFNFSHHHVCCAARSFTQLAYPFLFFGGIVFVPLLPSSIKMMVFAYVMDKMASNASAAGAPLFRR